MSILVWLIMGTNAQQGIILNVVVGIVGALIGGWLIGPLLGAGSINDGLSVMSFMVSLIGAVLLLAILIFFQRRAGSR